MKAFMEGVGDAMAYLGMGAAGVGVMVSVLGMGKYWAWWALVFGLLAVGMWLLEVGVVTFTRSRLLWTDTAFVGAMLALGFLFYAGTEDWERGVSQFLAGWGLTSFLCALAWGIPATAIRWFRDRRRRRAGV